MKKFVEPEVVVISIVSEQILDGTVGGGTGVGSNYYEGDEE